MTRSQTSNQRSIFRSLATFFIALLVGLIIVQVSHWTVSSVRGSGGQATRVPVKAIADKATLKPGQGMRYDLVLRADAQVTFEVRSTPVAITVALLSAQKSLDGQAPSGSSGRRTDAAAPMLWQHEGLIVTKEQVLPAGNWMLVIERSDSSASKRDVDTTITTEVTVL